MQFLDAWEWLESLRASGDNQIADFASELLELQRFEEIEQTYRELVEGLEYYHPAEKSPTPDKIVEWLGDRSHLLDDLREILTEHGISPETDLDDAIRAELSLLGDIRDALEKHNLWDAGDEGGDLLEAIVELTQRPFDL